MKAVPALALLLAALLLCACERAESEPRATPRPVPLKPALLPEGSPLPGFEDVKVGQVYSFKTFAGLRSDEVVARTDDELKVVRRATLAGNPDETELRVPLKAGAPPQPGATPPPPLAPGEKVGEETLQLAGLSLHCEVRELGGKSPIRSWVAARYPFLVRQTSGSLLVLELKSIAEPGARKEPSPDPGPPKETPK